MMNDFKIAVAVLVLSLNSCGPPEQKFEVTVVDENGKPMAGVECKAWFQKAGEKRGIVDYFVLAKSDANGKAIMQGQTVWGPTSVEAKKEGFYSAGAGEHWARKASGNRWKPWPVEVNLVMKRIVRPHSMYAVAPRDQPMFYFPDDRQLGPLGFDMEKMDWVEPNGKGKVVDVLIRGTRESPAEIQSSKSENVRILAYSKGCIHFSFPNPGDGIQRIADLGGSELLGPAVAPDGGYVDHWDFPNWQQSDGTGPKDSACFVFRVRSKRNELGRVVSAQYGKIMGNVDGRFLVRSRINLNYYFNQEANDKNLEWDMKTNLFDDLEMEYWPERP
jgi:hypothetical protein